MSVKKFIRNICILAFSLFAGVASGAGTPIVLGMLGLSHEFEGLGIFVGILVLAFSFNGLKSLLDGIDKKR